MYVYLSTPAHNDVNKKYVNEGLRTKISDTLQRELNTNNNAIVNLAPPFASADAANKEYVDEYFLRRDGTKPMYGNLNMGQQRITDLNPPTADNDAATKNEFASLIGDTDESSSERNIQVEGIVNFPQSPHKINKKA